MQIGLITLHDLQSPSKIGGGLFYRRQLLRILEEHHEVRVYRIPTIPRDTLPGKIIEKIALNRALQRIAGVSDLWIRDFRELRFIGPFRTRGHNMAIVHHIDSSSLPNRLYNAAFDRIGLKRLRAMDAVVAVSNFWRDYLAPYCSGPIHVIQPSVDTSLFREPDPSELADFKLKHGLGDLPIVYIGNNQAAKGAPLVYEALKDEGYQLVTSGPPQTRLQCLNLNLSYADYIRLLWVSDVAVLLSQFREGWCISAQEAMLCRNPVIGSGLGGMRELLEGGNQLVCRDPGRLPKLVRDLLEDRDMADAIGSSGRSFAMQFDLDRFETRWIRTLNTFSN
ncbi:MAG: glycosyltransferase [Candidatus Eisenbacteria bacterium]|nr:glycosyltransferase [Candidatus Eisenbacteria bacterium]